MPNCNQWVNPRVHWWLQQACRKQWGVLPEVCRNVSAVQVEVTHVLGPRERANQDEENWKLRFKGCFDAVWKGGYAVDDSPNWMQRVYKMDAGRRHEGPKVEVRIWFL
ncbi:MAG: hypothetical protein Q8P12_05505 [bacterium]|nr:hypothetical protein [bacterium]